MASIFWDINRRDRAHKIPHRSTPRLPNPRAGLCAQKMSIHHPLKADNISNYSTLTADQPAVVEAEAGPHEVPMTPPEAAGRWKTAMNKKPFEVNFETVSGSGVSHQELTIRSALFLDAHIAHGKQPVEFPPSSASNIQLWVAVSSICCF